MLERTAFGWDQGQYDYLRHAAAHLRRLARIDAAWAEVREWARFDIPPAAGDLVEALEEK